MLEHLIKNGGSNSSATSNNQKESDFNWLAKTTKEKIFNLIPFKRPSSSFGYSQAVKELGNSITRNRKFYSDQSKI